MTAENDNTVDDASGASDSGSSEWAEPYISWTNRRPITRRGALYSGIGAGLIGWLLCDSEVASANPGNPQRGGGTTPDDLDRSPIRVSLERKVAAAHEDDSFRVQLHTEPGEREAAHAVIKEAGGEIISSSESLVLADLPAHQVNRVAHTAPVRLVGEFVPPKPVGRTVPNSLHKGTPHPASSVAPSVAPSDSGGEDLLTSEGVAITGAAELHEQGITGDGVTIAVLDHEFDVNNEQYADQVVATLGASEGELGYEAAYEVPGGHGDAVTDIVAAMAPDADLILGDVFFVIEGFGTLAALHKIETEYPEVDVLNYSVIHFPEIRLDGLNPISNRFAAFAEEIDGMISNSAGNEAATDYFWEWDSDKGKVKERQQGIGGTYDSQGPAQFTTDRGRELLNFGANFDPDVPFPTRLPIFVPFHDVTAFAALGEPLGWTVTHWDADPDIDDQIYQVRLYEGPETRDPLVVSRTTNPWETIEIRPEYLMGDVHVTVTIEDNEWVLTRVRSDREMVPTASGADTLELAMGQRYRFANEDWRDHPLEFRNAAGDVLLRQDGTGTFAAAEGVDPVSRGRSITFTVTAGLGQALDHVGSAVDATIDIDVDVWLPPPVFLEIQRLRADEPHHFDVWTPWDAIWLVRPWATDQRSVGIPGVSRDADMLAVAAVQAVDVGPDQGETRSGLAPEADHLKEHSSQGPTQDGRRGIELAGPSHVSTNARGSVEEVVGMNGTSAAAPHVAGAIALLSQIDDVGRAAIRGALFETSRGIADPDVGTPGMDNEVIGSGHVDVAEAYDVLRDEVS